MSKKTTKKKNKVNHSPKPYIKKQLTSNNTKSAKERKEKNGKIKLKSLSLSFNSNNNNINKSNQSNRTENIKKSVDSLVVSIKTQLNFSKMTRGERIFNDFIRCSICLDFIILSQENDTLLCTSCHGIIHMKCYSIYLTTINDSSYISSTSIIKHEKGKSYTGRYSNKVLYLNSFICYICKSNSSEVCLVCDKKRDILIKYKNNKGKDYSSHYYCNIISNYMYNNINVVLCKKDAIDIYGCNRMVNKNVHSCYLCGNMNLKECMIKVRYI